MEFFLLQKQSTTTSRQEKTKGISYCQTSIQKFSRFFFQEFFERKRLQSKVKKIIQPKSPREGSSRGISKDLLFLQAVSKAHDGSTGMAVMRYKTNAQLF